jgi:glycosyltransferase involved in cell wall biosynthesis
LEKERVSAPRRVLVVHPSNLRGENQGLYIQHVSSLRWLLPEERGWSVAALDPFHPAFPEAALQSDVVVVHMLPHREIEAMIRLRRERSLPTVFELSDNFLAIGSWVPKNNLLRSPLVRQRLLYHASLCDALQVYAPGLQKLFSRVNPRLVLFDPYVPIPDAPPEKPGGFVFGWGGTTSHEHDLQRIAPAIIDFCARHDDVVFAYMGDVEMFGRLFGAIRPEQTRVTPFGAFDSYLELVRGLHVGIAPARSSAFNAGRSDTKLVTYAASSVAPLLEAVPPYEAHAEHAMLFRDADDLRAALERLHADRSLLAEVAARALAWAREERAASRLATQRDAFYRSLLRPEPVDAFAIEPAPAEAATLVDLGKRKPEDALAAAREIAALHPTYAQARWAVASTLAALGRVDETLEELQRFDWPPLYGDSVEELRARVIGALRPGEAEAHIERIRSPFIRIRLRARGQSDRDAFFRAILEEQPYDYFALSAVIRMLEREDPLSSELETLYERACLIAPEMVPVERRPSSLAHFFH